MTTSDNEPEWIPCEHLLALGEKYDPMDGRLIFIGNERVVSLCQLCTDALAYAVLKTFNAEQIIMVQPRYHVTLPNIIKK